MRKYEARAKALVQAFAKINHTAEAAKNTHGGTEDYVIVYAQPADRYPAHTVWVDADGYTWGHSFEHNMGPKASATVVAQAVVDTLTAWGEAEQQAGPPPRDS